MAHCRKEVSNLLCDTYVSMGHYPTIDKALGFSNSNCSEEGWISKVLCQLS